jgi:hypothetical protein
VFISVFFESSLVLICLLLLLLLLVLLLCLFLQGSQIKEAKSYNPALIGLAFVKVLQSCKEVHLPAQVEQGGRISNL